MAGAERLSEFALVLEAVSAVVAAGLGALALVRHRARREPPFLLLGAGLWAVALLDALRAGSAWAPLAGASSPDRWLLAQRLPEIVPAALFAAVVSVVLRGGRPRSDGIDAGVAWGAAAALVAPLLVLAGSRAPFDGAFATAQALELGASAILGGALLAALHRSVLGEGAARRAGSETAEALARETQGRREAEQRLQDFLDSAHDLIQSTGRDGRILYVNRAWERALGYPRSEMEGTELAALLHPRCRRRVLAQLEAVRRGEPVVEIVAEFVARDGRVVVCAGRATRRVVDGEAVATQSAFRDVTAQREAERELAASRANVQALVENTGDLIWSVDTGGRLVTFNSAFALATEARWGREPRVGDAPADLFGDEAAAWYETLYGRVLRGQRFSDLREERVAGQLRAFEIFCNPVSEGDGTTGAVMFGRDVTRRLEAEEALRVAKEEAESANRAKSQFLANMSHELRTPLNSVIGFANILLKNKRGNLEEQDLGFLGRILANGRHLLALINEVLDLAKIEAGRMEVQKAQVDLPALVAETVSQLEGQAREKHVTLLAALPEGSVPTVETDSAKLKQVLINLVGNALKFSEGGVVTVRLELLDDGTAGALAVADTGIGIPPDRLQAIFEAFAQADASTSRRFGGTGLGLAISRSICQVLGYDLEVASTVGEGSTFTIRMAAAAPDAPAAAPAAAGPAPEPDEPDEPEAATGLRPGPRDWRILVVDDGDDARVLLTHHLQELGCTVMTASSGAEALQRAREARPDLITLDLMMPGIDGPEVLRRLKRDPSTRSIPVVVVSVDALEGRDRLEGAADLITKPVDREDLLRVLWRHLVRRGRPRLLLLEPDDGRRERLGDRLAEVGLQVRRAATVEEGMRALGEEPPDAVVLGLGLPDGGSFAFLDRLRAHPWRKGLPVVALAPTPPSDEERAELARTASSVLAVDEDLERLLLRTLGAYLPLGARWRVADRP